MYHITAHHTLTHTLTHCSLTSQIVLYVSVLHILLVLRLGHTALVLVPLLLLPRVLLIVLSVPAILEQVAGQHGVTTQHFIFHIKWNICLYLVLYVVLNLCGKLFSIILFNVIL